MYERERRVLDAELGVERHRVRDAGGVEGEEAALHELRQVARHLVALLQAAPHPLRQGLHVGQAHRL